MFYVIMHTAAQARFQLAALASTLIISIGGGIVTGLIIKHPFFVYKGVKKVSQAPHCSGCSTLL